MATETLFDMGLKFNEIDVAIHFSFDLDLMSNRIIHNALSSGGFYESELSFFLLRVLKPGDTFVDIGAHIGFFSLLASKLVSDTGRIISIEPDDVNVEHLEKHKEMNGSRNIEIFKTLLCGEIGPKTFYINADNDGGHCLWDVGLHPFNKKSAAQPVTTTVEAETLDSILDQAGAGTVKLVKMDTEGAEPEVIKGAAASIGNHNIPFILSEVNEFGLKQMGYSQDSLRSIMKSHGYDTFLLNGEGDFPKHIPPTVPLATRSSSVFNVLFSNMDDLAPYWGVEILP